MHFWGVQVVCGNVETYFFCVSPAFTRIRRTSKTGLAVFTFQLQKECLTCFQKELKDSLSPSQVRWIFSRSPISSSVNTRKVLVKFIPTGSSWLDKESTHQGYSNVEKQRNVRLVLLVQSNVISAIFVTDTLKRSSRTSLV